MNPLERFRALMDFRPVDRLPRIEWAPWWDRTLQRWRGEGLPADLTDGGAIQEHLGLDPMVQLRFVPRARSYPPPPRHGAGNVAGTEDYDRLREHLYPGLEEAYRGVEDPAAAREALASLAARQGRGEVLLWLTLDGFFWYPRTLLGIERHLVAFYDQPDLMRRMNADLAAWHEALLPEVVGIVRPAFMTLAEDMSYNHGPMISREQFEAFVAPSYRRVVPLAKRLGIPVFVDSDGDVTAMVPWLESAGVDGVLPLERQAGVDAGALRRAHPRLRMIGHYDKMVMTRGEAAMRAEFERLLPVMRGGGFVPSVDHQTPPGVSLADYRVYVRLLAEYSERGAARGG